MTDKPIIIDGVDVSGCDFLAREDFYSSYSGEYSAYKGQCGCSDDEMCKDHRNCGYKKLAKQLQRTFQDSFQHISNTIPKTLNNNTKEYIYNTHTSKKSVCEENKNLSAEDLIILKKYAKENGAKKIKPYVAKLIENGGYLNILKEEKEKTAKDKRLKQKEVIPPSEKIDKSTPEEDKAGLKLLRETVQNIRKRG